MLEELGLPLPNPIAVYYKVKNLPKEYDIQKQMIHLKLESKHLALEMVRKSNHEEEKESEVLVALLVAATIRHQERDQEVV